METAKWRDRNCGFVLKNHLSPAFFFSRSSAYSITAAATGTARIIDLTFIDLKNKPDILATLYSLGRSPHGDPKSNERGSQIADEFYQLVKDYLQ